MIYKNIVLERERERERENPCVRVALYPGKMFVATLSLYIFIP